MPRCFGIFALTGLIGTAGCGDSSGAAPRDRCWFEPIAPDQSVDGESPLELSRGIEGTHTAPLSWFETELVARDSGEPLLEDELTLSLDYDGGEARSGCGTLGIEMNAAFATRESAVVASGAVWVEFNRRPRFGMRLPSETCTESGPRAGGAGFTLVDGEHSIVAGISQYPEGALLSGRFWSEDPDVPGEFAWFPSATTCERTELPTSEVFQPTAQEILAAIAELDPKSVPWEPEIGALELELSADGSLCDTLGLATLPVSGTVAPPGGPWVSVTGHLGLLHDSGDPRVKAFGLSLEPTQGFDREAFLPVSPECDLAIEWYATVLPSNELEVTRATPFADCDCR